MSNYQDILIALRRITRAIDLHSKTLVRTSGLTTPQLLVLQAIRKTGRAKPSEIARDVLLSQATITSIVDRLETAGLARREKSTTDRRAVEVTLTEDGERKLINAPDMLQTGFLQKFAELEDWERSQLTASLQRIASMMDSGETEGAPLLEIGEFNHTEQTET